MEKEAKKRFKEQYPIEGRLVLSTIHNEKIFQIIPLVSLEMDNDQIAAELKVARIKLNESIKKYDEELRNRNSVNITFHKPVEQVFKILGLEIKVDESVSKYEAHLIDKDGTRVGKITNIK